ncbi:MAG TPA: hypothetical protein VGC13_09505 [Longimicrobium sp.]|jgi:hypothetical protein|uniref:hypothetical protein n=1 Tax=Longimicrobium sp. TaxID=2029185 RepID=UPI002EDB5FD5
MRGKLSLNLEDLTVDSFDTTSTQKAKGTVFGEQCTCYTNCTCPGCPTCYASCNGTCDNTCANTCAYTCDDASCVNTCNGCNYSDVCNSRQPCPTALYSACNGYDCY